MNNLGAQLYTVRNYFDTPSHMQNALSNIKEIGYTSVQLFGDASLAEALAKTAHAEGLHISGILAELENYEQELDTYLQICGDYDIPDLAISGFLTEEKDVASYIQRVNTVAEKIRAHGRTFSYHNHADEFIKMPDGKTIMDHYIEGFEPTLVDFMPDTHWLHRGGCDVRHMLERLRGRVHMLHLKDLKYTKDGPTFAEIGKGNLYFEGIIPLALDCGITHFVVEQDECDGDPIESLKQSFDYLKVF